MNTKLKFKNEIEQKKELNFIDKIEYKKIMDQQNQIRIKDEINK